MRVQLLAGRRARRPKPIRLDFCPRQLCKARKRGGTTHGCYAMPGSRYCRFHAPVSGADPVSRQSEDQLGGSFTPLTTSIGG